MEYFINIYSKISPISDIYGLRTLHFNDYRVDDLMLYLRSRTSIYNEIYIYLLYLSYMGDNRQYLSKYLIYICMCSNKCYGVKLPKNITYLLTDTNLIKGDNFCNLQYYKHYRNTELEIYGQYLISITIFGDNIMPCNICKYLLYYKSIMCRV